MSVLLPEPTARLTFGRMGPEDLDDLAALMASPEVMAFFPRTRSRAEAAEWIEWNQQGYARDGLGLWVLHDANGTFVGQCGLSWQWIDGAEHLEVGYHLMPEHQGRGLATEAALASRDFARIRGITRLIAIIHRDNLASQRVAGKIGLALESEGPSALGVPTRIYATTL
ncbi:MULTISPECIES: GNAT family N-acetyltransferase [unclassified Nocardioides]|uniref:GNAT family N-acetyltransferase n=1 Tax=unclassified Nocardioides TaxID=2615069 RepID=UPI0006F4AFD4|nr:MULTISPECIES: GNAT family N-acetyltransferase [unclassified Nocardioides]KQY64514.1 hypothetical protein ASD30_06235 [Nocardioides sp. Root140]KRF18300.1 hypothetical protein ASH02_01705 [Nocardioides sp. Soil796]